MVGLQRVEPSKEKGMLDQHLGHLERYNLIHLAQQEPDLEYLFRHALVQDVAYGSLLRRDRRRLHRTVGQTLEALFPERLHELAPLLAQHFQQAEEQAQAAHYYTLAGDEAYERYALEEASMLYRQGLALVPLQGEVEHRLHLYTRLGRSLELSGLYEQAGTLYEAMEAEGQAQDEGRLELWALIYQGTIRSIPAALHDPALGRELAERGLALARALQDRRAEAKILWNLLLLSRFIEDTAQALQYGERSLEIARELGWREQMAYTMHDLHMVYIELGQGERGVEILHEAVALWRELGNQAMLADGLASIAIIHTALGDFETALQLSAEAQAVSDRIDNAWNQGYSRMLTGLLFFEQGRFSDAIRVMKECIAFGQRAGFLPGVIQARGQLVLLYGWLGLLEEAQQWLDEVQEILEQFPSPWQASARGLIGLLRLWQGQDEEAATWIAAGRQFATQQADTSSLPNFLFLAEAELARVRAEHARLLALADEQVVYLGRLSVRLFLPVVHLARGQALQGLGELAAAQDALQEALDEATRQGAQRSRLMVLSQLVELKGQQGATAEAERYTKEALTLAKQLAEQIEEDMIRHAFWEHPRLRLLREGEP